MLPPPSTSTAERTFDDMKLIKSQLRNRLGENEDTFDQTLKESTYSIIVMKISIQF